MGERGGNSIPSFGINSYLFVSVFSANLDQTSTEKFVFGLSHVVSDYCNHI